MSRKLRLIPEGGSLVEVTNRTIQGRLLLRPSPQLNDIILGVLGRAQRLYPLEILGYVFASNHYHLLLRVKDAAQLARFMCYFDGNLAREVARLTGWENKVWARRYQAILVTEEEAAQVGRLKYLLENSCREGLVESPIHWPGAHCAKALITGDRVEGTWFDRKHENNARLRGKEPGPREFAKTEEVVLSPLPCWGSLEPSGGTCWGERAGLVARAPAEPRSHRGCSGRARRARSRSWRKRRSRMPSGAGLTRRALSAAYSAAGGPAARNVCQEGQEVMHSAPVGSLQVVCSALQYA